MTVHHLVGPVSGEVVRLAPGDSLEIGLTQQAGGGYLWSVVETPPVLRLTDDRRRPGVLPGAAGQVVLEFEAVAPGTGTLTLAHARPWEDEALERVAVRIEIG